MPRAVFALCWGSAIGQQAGDNRDFHLPLPIKHCTKAGKCTEESTTATLDANWRWSHPVGGWDHCYDASGWNPQYCPDEETCSKTCAVEGIDEAGWRNNYGVTTVNNGVKLKYVPGSRMYLLDSQSTYKMFSLKNKEFAVDIDASNLPCGVNGALYFSEMERDGGKASSNGLNTAGAEYGSGYCDAQCPTDIHFIGGYANIDNKYGACCAEFDIWEANSQSTAYTAHPCNLEGPERVQCHGTPDHHHRRRRRSSPPAPAPSPSGGGCCSWTPSGATPECGETTEYCKGSSGNCQTCGGHWVPNNQPTTTGCCSWAIAQEAQICGETTEYCKGSAGNCETCGGHWVPGAAILEEELDDELEAEEAETGSLPPCDGGKCDQPGCDFNPYRNGIRDFYGPGWAFELDSSKPFTVITEFVTHDGTDDGDLVEVRRSYVQGKKIIHNPAASYAGASSYDSLADDTCAEQKGLFNRSGTNEFKNNGGMTKMGEAVGRGMVLALSVWDDGADKMQWLDGWEPEDPDEPNGAGAARGPCSRNSGDPSATRKSAKDAYVIYSNIRYGEIGSTHMRRRRRRSSAIVADVIV